MTTIPYKTYLTEDEIPRRYYNFRADMPQQHAPFLHPGTLQPLQAQDLYPIFCEELCNIEMDTTTRYIDIPEAVLDYYRTFRPSPLIRAYHLEKALDTPAKIYYKFEGNNTSGSHKLNAAALMAYYAKAQGLKSLTTETGAGQWGTALAMACAYYGLDLTVYMVKVSFEQKPFRKAVIETYGGKIIASPSGTTEVGRKILAENPDTGGSLGCAISEAIEASMGDDNCRYALGSVLNQVLVAQSVIGLESKAAMEKLGEYPDIVIGCAGGGSNLGGLISAFLQDKLTGKANPRFIAVEPASCPSLTRGVYAYDFCDTGRITPLAKMYTLGSGFIPSPNHAGGLRYHGMAPSLSRLYHDGYMEAIAVEQNKAFNAAVTFAKHEQILPAPESAHAIYSAIEEALKCKESGEAKTILFGLSGTGYFDMNAYMAHLSGTMTDHAPSDEELRQGFATLPQVE
ncbi:MAG: TrpB-like pyridoxal phosphate-dependent enzyme [Clostridia bacterium]|nr:TrpB-like pyridoxal phosphate-dependent enzyme [Clostridia bacterium]